MAKNRPGGFYKEESMKARNTGTAVNRAAKRRAACAVAFLYICVICAAIFSTSLPVLSPAHPPAHAGEPELIPNDKPRTWYEVFVYSYCDSDGDGIGDINGLTAKLPYIKEMGFTGVWLMPIHPSPTYHKYDVADYLQIDPQYGTLDDFAAFMDECDRLGISVILDLVVNHTSSSHPWFLAALAELEAGKPGKYAAYYNFEKRASGGKWCAAGNSGYAYEASFWSGMPDLNLNNEDVRQEIRAIAEYWLEKGVCGFRLDAVKEFVSGDVRGNIEILKWISGMIRGIKPDAYIVGENWDTSDAMYKYYEGVDSLFNYPFATSSGYIARALIQDKGRNALRLLTAMTRSEELIAEHGGAMATDAPFFVNHDNARAAGFLRRNPNLIKMGWAINLMMSGDAFVYYGEEIGMPGSGIDDNKRGPMLWSANGEGVTAGPPNMDALQYAFPPVDEQLADPSSILRFIKEAVRVRTEYRAISLGKSRILRNSAEPVISSLEKTYGGERVVLLYNLSDAEQYAEPLDGEGFGNITDWLSAGGEAPRVSGAGVAIPPYTIVVMMLSR